MSVQETEGPEEQRNLGERRASPSITFESITFSDGSTVDLGLTDIVVLVGPNNAGKSVAIREMEQSLGKKPVSLVLQSAKLRKIGEAAEIEAFIETSGKRVVEGGKLYYRGLGYKILSDHIEHFWLNDLQNLKSLFLTRLPTESRITDSNRQGSIAVLEESASHPLHLLYADDRLEARISRYFRRAFGNDLIVFRGGGSVIPLMVGERPALESGEDRVSATYLERIVAQTQPLQEQGDGMRSFASVILHLLTPNTQSLLLLDEPEAFLHPPQARLLGEFIAKERPKGSQLIVATHSPDVLQGLLNVAPDELRIIRIQRQGPVNRAKELDKMITISISKDPLMKFSGILSGIFHERVIITEADADSLFYGAILDLSEIHGEKNPDVLFAHAGGKHRMAALAEALRALDVPVDIIADIDVLNDEATFRRLVETLGGDWARAGADAVPLKRAIEQHKPWLTSAEVSNAISTLLESAPQEGEFPKETRRKIEAIFRKASPWDAVKDAGEAAIPSGQPTNHYARLKEYCSGIGLWIVPVGELEGFCRSVGGKGPRWVQRVIDGYDLSRSPELESARKFVSAIWKGVPDA